MEQVCTRARLLIAVDDTDRPGEGGTGRVARTIAARLASRFPVWGVTRHQFVILPGINYTSRNSGNVIHLLEAPAEESELAREIEPWIREMALPGAEPGLCVSRPEVLLSNGLGMEAQRRIVSQEEVRASAAEVGAILRHPGEGDNGIIGAFAAACLAASGNDGRFVDLGRIREISGEQSAQEMLAAGIDEIRAVKDVLPPDARILAERVRPAFRGGKSVLYCFRLEDGLWSALVGAPGDREKEESARADR